MAAVHPQGLQQRWPVLATAAPSLGATSCSTSSPPTPVRNLDERAEEPRDCHDEAEALMGESPSIWTERDEELDPADVFFKTDITDAVAVAAFGGVQLNLDGDQEMSIHPAVLWVLCLPLICAQFALTFCVGINIDLDDPIVHHQEDAMMELSLKVLLIIIAQLTFFDRMLSTLRMFLFTMNPASWTDIKRIDTGLRKAMASRLWWMHSAGVLCFFPASAMFLKLCTMYYVNVQSASIILASDDLNEAVFDSLAIAFILELDEVVWNFAKTILHLDDFDSFVFRLWPKERRDAAIKRSCLRPLLRLRVLHRGTGARRLENFLSFVIMFAIYFRLLMNILYAIETNTIPATRDVCLMHAWLTEGSVDNPFQATVFSYVMNFLLWPFRPWWRPVEELKKRADLVCSGDKNFEHLQTSQGHWRELMTQYPTVTAVVCTMLVMMLILPELFLEKGKIREKLLKWDTPLEQEAEEGQEQEKVLAPLVHLVEASGKGMSKRLDRMRRDMSDLRAENDSLRDEIRHLNKRISRAGF